MIPQIYNDKEAAKLINKSASWLRKHRGPRGLSGGPKYIRMGSSIRYAHDDLIEYLQQNTVQS